MTVRTALIPLAALLTLSLPACSAATGAGVAGGSMDAFSDANVAASASASNMDEIQTSQLALQKTQTPAVREFAQMMVTEHGRVEQQMQEMLAAKGMAPMDNALSGTMKRNLPRTLEMLRGMNGMQFDMAYMQHQVAAHEMTLHTLDTSLIPSTMDGDMKAMLQNVVRPAVAQHLQRAQQILMSMHGR